MSKPNIAKAGKLLYTQPKFEFHANSAAPDDKSGMAVWRYFKLSRGDEIEVIVRQPFDSFTAAHAINEVIEESWRAGEAAGYANCERRVLNAL